MQETQEMNAKFRAAFGIPAHHVLRSISYTASMTGANLNWQHHELDPDGRLVARYRSWYTDGSEYGVDTGFEQFDPNGVVVRKGPLPPI